MLSFRFRPLVLFLILILLVFSFLSLAHPIHGATTVTHDFANSQLYDNDSFSNDYVGLYNATYSFNNEVGLNGTSVSLIDECDIRTCTVISEYQEHHNVLKLATIPNWKYIKDDFNGVSNPIIEFWIYRELGQATIRFDSPTNMVYFHVKYDRLTAYYGDGAGGYNTQDFMHDYVQWNHIKVDIDTDNDVYSIYVNGDLVVNEFTFIYDRTCTEITRMQVHLSTNSIFYFDGIGYSFDPYYSIGDNINPVSTEWNMRDIQEYTEIYNGTYTFTNEVGLQLDNISFVSTTSGAGVGAEIIDTYEGHSEVMNVSSTGTFDWVRNQIVSTESGIIELWICKDSTAERMDVRCDTEAGEGFVCYFSNAGNIHFFNGSSVNLGTYEVNQWYHLRFVFNCTLDTVSLYINQELKVENWGFRNKGNGLVRMYFIGRSVFGSALFDGIGYSWDSYYNMGDNFVPLVNYSNYNGISQEIDRFEFALEGYNDIYDNGDDYLEWSEMDLGGTVDIDSSGWGAYDRALDITSELSVGTDGISGIKRDFGVSTCNIINVSFFFEIVSLSNPNGRCSFGITSYDGSLLANFSISNDALPSNRYLQYYNGTSWNTFYKITDYSNDNHSLSIYIDYSAELVKFTHVNTTDTFITYLDILTSNKTGLGLVKITFDSSSGIGAIHNNLEFDWIGVYADGKSLSDEMSYLTLDLNSNWNLEYHNLFTSKMNGTIGIRTKSRPYKIGDSISNINYEYEFNNSEVLFNLYDFGGEISNATLIFFTIDRFEMESLFIEGVSMENGASYIFPTFEHGNVDTNESYFYVSGSRLYFNTICDDSTTEYISLDFDIDNLIGYNYTFSFRGFINVDSGFYRINYTDDTSNLIEIQNFASTTTALMSQDKEVSTIGFLITDNDDYSSKIISGWVDNVQFIYLPDSDLTFATTTLLLALIPLIVLIVIPLLIGARFGRTYIVPTLILMGIILFIGGLIPIWLMLMILVGGFFFIIYDNRRG